MNATDNKNDKISPDNSELVEVLQMLRSIRKRHFFILFFGAFFGACCGVLLFSSLPQLTAFFPRLLSMLST